MKNQSDSTVFGMGLFSGIKAAEVTGPTLNHNLGSKFSSPVKEHALGKIVLTISVVSFVLAVLARGCDAEIGKPIIVRVSINVVDVATIRNFNPHQSEDDSMGWVHTSEVVPLQLHDAVSRVFLFGIAPRFNQGASSSGSFQEPSVSVVPFEVGSRPLFPFQLPGIGVVCKTLLKELPRRERFRQIHSSFMSLGALFGVSPVGAPLSLSDVYPTFNS